MSKLIALWEYRVRLFWDAYLSPDLWQSAPISGGWCVRELDVAWRGAVSAFSDISEELKSGEGMDVVLTRSQYAIHCRWLKHHNRNSRAICWYLPSAACFTGELVGPDQKDCRESEVWGKGAEAYADEAEVLARECEGSEGRKSIRIAPKNSLM